VGSEASESADKATAQFISLGIIIGLAQCICVLVSHSATVVQQTRLSYLPTALNLCAAIKAASSLCRLIEHPELRSQLVTNCCIRLGAMVV
jgi:hypothetical protein